MTTETTSQNSQTLATLELFFARVIRPENGSVIKILMYFLLRTLAGKTDIEASHSELATATALADSSIKDALAYALAKGYLIIVRSGKSTQSKTIYRLNLDGILPPASDGGENNSGENKPAENRQSGSTDFQPSGSSDSSDSINTTNNYKLELLESYHASKRKPKSHCQLCGSLPTAITFKRGKGTSPFCAPNPDYNLWRLLPTAKTPHSTENYHTYPTPISTLTPTQPQTPPASPASQLCRLLPTAITSRHDLTPQPNPPTSTPHPTSHLCQSLPTAIAPAQDPDNMPQSAYPRAAHEPVAPGRQAASSGNLCGLLPTHITSTGHDTVKHALSPNPPSLTPLAPKRQTAKTSSLCELGATAKAPIGHETTAPSSLSSVSARPRKDTAPNNNLSGSLATAIAPAEHETAPRNHQPDTTQENVAPGKHTGGKIRLCGSETTAIAPADHGTAPVSPPSPPLGRPAKAESTYLTTLARDFSAALGDAAHTRSNITQVRNLWHKSGLTEAEFAAKMYRARDLTRWHAHQRPGEVVTPGHVRNTMPYFFTTLRDVLGLTTPKATRHYLPDATATASANSSDNLTPASSARSNPHTSSRLAYAQADTVPTKPVTTSPVTASRSNHTPSITPAHRPTPQSWQRLATNAPTQPYSQVDKDTRPQVSMMDKPDSASRKNHTPSITPPPRHVPASWLRLAGATQATVTQT